MADFFYTSATDEWWELLDTVLQECAGHLVVDQPYPGSKVTYHAALTADVRGEVLNATRSIYLFPDDPRVSNAFLRRQPTGACAGMYFIDTSRGGPSVRIHMPAQFEDDHLIWFGAAKLTIQSNYWNDSFTQSYAAPAYLKSYFAAIKRTIQKRMLKKEIAGQARWISAVAWQLFEDGKAAVGQKGKCYTIDGEVPPPTVWRRTPIISISAGGRTKG